VNTLKLIKDGVDGVSLALSSLELIKFLEQTNVKFIKVKSTCQDGNIFPRNYKDIDSNLLIWGVAIIFMIICSVGIFLLNQNPSKKTLYKMNTENDDENYSYFLSGFKKDGLPVRLKLKEDQLNRKYGIHIGRALDFTDNVIKSAEISRIHARIYNNQNGVFIEDLGSSNGIFINNKKINSFIPHQILLNDKLVFGDVELVLTN
ncbi:MAG: FHA domain-containing protein, partial [Flavobacteriaceae bacterium]|nr:FHA domain-containing protein [Flavobacteriaceae bacterium]